MTTAAPQYKRFQNPRDIEMDLVEVTSFNPLQRRQKVDDLKANIAAYGQLEPAHLVWDAANERFILADGNRRFTSLQLLGKETIRAFVYEPQGNASVQDVVNFLFVELNQPKMTLKNGQMLQGRLLGAPDFNPTVRASAKFFEKHFSPEEIVGLVKQNVTPTLLANAKRIAAYCVPGVGKDTPTYTNRVRKTLYWLIRRKTQQECIAYMRLGYSAEALRKAIDADKEHAPRMAPGSASDE